MDESNLKKIRLEKLEKIKSLGINPYPIKADRKNTISEALNSLNKKVSVVGRLFSFREHGNIVFADLKDETGKIQIFFQKKLLGENFKNLKLLDIGDFIQVEGEVLKTVAGEISVAPTFWKILAKSMNPLPNEWYGLKDIEARYRKRYLDLLLNDESRTRFLLRTKIISAVREYLNNDGAIEVETPTLQPLYGGANARPFITHHNALDNDFYLKISDELYLKRLVIGGIEKVYEIDHDFRNEGIDKSHNPEFTMLEIYYAYANYEDMMMLTENIWEYVAKKTLGTTKICYNDLIIDIKAPWRRLTMKNAIKEYLKLDIDNMKDEEIITAVKKYEPKFDSKNVVKGLLIAKLFEFAEKYLIQPTFIIDFPKETTALCKPKDDDSDIIERFEPYINGWEVGNAYTELNNPILQRKYFEDQLKNYEKNKEEAQPLDEDFLTAMEYGMPPMGGLGLGLDRMVMILTNAKTIKDVILFPTMKPDQALKKEAKELGKNIIESGEKQFGKYKDNSSVATAYIRDEAFFLLKQHIKTLNLIKHCLSAEVAMKGIYRYLHKDNIDLKNENIWGITGLLHDVDYEIAQKEGKLDKHGVLLFEKDPDFILEPMAHAIKAHNYTKTGVEPESDLDWAITTVDQLTGLIVSCALVYPDKKLSSLSVEFILKKFNTPSFSKGVDRKNIKLCENKLKIPLTDFIEITLKAMQSISTELGL